MIAFLFASDWLRDGHVHLVLANTQREIGFRLGDFLAKTAVHWCWEVLQPFCNPAESQPRGKAKKMPDPRNEKNLDAIYNVNNLATSHTSRLPLT